MNLTPADIILLRHAAVHQQLRLHDNPAANTGYVPVKCEFLLELIAAYENWVSLKGMLEESGEC